ncbi:MAG: superoxide dismutase [Mucinivorans sp.]
MKKFEIPQLPYSIDALSPAISALTLSYHYGRHTVTYFNNVNILIQGSEYEEFNSLRSVVLKASGPLLNNAAQAWNHIFYFESFSPAPQLYPQGRLLEKIMEQWGSVELFKKEFVALGVAIFGSGWVWLASDKAHHLTIEKCSNGDNPMIRGLVPLLAFDVWEHAYYLDYQNNRAVALGALWTIVDWAKVEKRFNF